MYDYRLIQSTYRQRIEYEDGPGSLQNIVSDVSHRVLYKWKNESEDFGKVLLKEGLSGLPRNSSDGRYDYNHKLERRLTGATSEWEYVGFINARKSHDDDYDEYEEGGY